MKLKIIDEYGVNHKNTYKQITKSKIRNIQKNGNYIQMKFK